MPGAESKPAPGAAHGFRVRRWLSVVLRGVHLAAVIALGIDVLSTAAQPYAPHAGAIVLGSGVAIWLLDLWQHPGHLVEGAGLSLFAKLALVAWMLAQPALREPLFWVIVIWSAVFSHAPASFRNARPFARRER